MILLKIIKTSEEAQVFWQIASPLIEEYEEENMIGGNGNFIWMRFRLRSDGWNTIDHYNVQILVESKWNHAISNDHGGVSNSDLRLLMGRYQVEVSNFVGTSHDPSREDDL